MELKDYYARIDERIKKKKADTTPSQAPVVEKKRKVSYHPIEYPIVIKAHQGHLIFSMPDFMISHVSPLPEGGFDPKFLHEMAKSIAKTWLMAKKRIETLKEYDAKVPTPTMIKDVLKRNGKRKISVAEAAVLLGRSQMTIRRMADRGELPCKKSSGGHREFLFKDILKKLNM